MTRSRLLLPIIALSLLAGAGTSAGQSAAETARSKGSQANTPPSRSGEQKLSRSDPEWQDIQDALDILDKEGKGWVRKCVEDMMAAGNISLDADMDEVAMYSGGLGPEEMYIKPSELPSGQRRRDGSGMDPAATLAQQAEYYKRLVSLAGTLLHECNHRKHGLLGRLGNYWGSKIGELSLSANGEEALTHHDEFLFYYGLFTSAQLSGTECAFLEALLDLMKEKIDIIRQEYMPYPLLGGMEEMYEERRKEWRKICGDSTGATVVDGFYDEEADRVVGRVDRKHDLRVRAVIHCEPDPPRVVSGRVHGWPVRSRFVSSGGTVTLTAPQTFQDGVLESVVVDGSPGTLSGTSVTVTVSKSQTVEFRYRCKKNVAAAAAAERSALEEQAREADRDIGRLEEQEEALERLDLACEDECERLRRELAELEGRLDQARRDLVGLQADQAAKEAARDATQGEIDALNDALADWNAKTPEERDAEKRAAAEAYEQAAKDAAAERAAAAGELQGEWEALDADRRAAAQRGSAHYFEQLPGFRQRSREAWDRYKGKTDAADAEVEAAWDRYKDADAKDRHDREMPGLQARLAGQVAAAAAAARATAAKGREIEDLERERDLLRERLRLCEERWQRVRDQLGLVRDSLVRTRAHRAEVGEALGGQPGEPTPDEVRRLQERRAALDTARGELREIRDENDELKKDLEDATRRLDGLIRDHDDAVREARDEAAGASDEAAAKRAEADRLDRALAGSGDPEADAAEAARRFAAARAEVAALLARELPRIAAAAGVDVAGQDAAALRRGWLAWECFLLYMRGWRSFMQETEGLAEDAAARAAARTDPAAVRARRDSLRRDASGLDRQAEGLTGTGDSSALLAEEARDRRAQVRQQETVAQSIGFETMLALAMLDAEARALGGGDDPDGVTWEVRSTGNATGHVANARVTNGTGRTVVFLLERGLTLLGRGGSSDVAVTEEARVEVPPGQSAEVPVQGCQMEPGADPAGEGGAYDTGEVDSRTVEVLDATDEALAAQGLEPTSARRATVAQWSLWRLGGVTRDEMSAAAVLGTLDLIGSLEGGDLGDVLGGLLQARARQQEAERLMDAVDAVVETTTAPTV